MRRRGEKAGVAENKQNLTQGVRKNCVYRQLDMSGNPNMVNKCQTLVQNNYDIGALFLCSGLWAKDFR